MAIDPNIIGQLNIPQFKPVDPLATMAQLENLKGLQEQRQALAEERQQQTQALIQKAKDTAAINAALQDSNGDLLGAGDSLTKAGMGTLGQMLYDADAKKRKGIADAVDAEGKASSAQLDMATKIIGTMGDSPQHYQAGYTALGGLITDPNVRQALGQMLPQNPDPSEISGIVDRLGNLSLSMKDRLDRRDKYVQGFLKGEYQPNLAGELAETPMDQRGDTLKAALALVPDYQTRQALQQTFEPLLGATPDVLNQFALTPEQRQKSAEEKARADAEAAKATSKPVLLDGKPAEVRFNQQGQPIDDAGKVIPSARVKPIPPASASAGVDATPNDPKDIAAAIIRGEQPPVLTGMYRDAAPIRAELARQGYPLAKATEDWTATQKYLATLNGQQQTRLRQAIDFTGSSLDLVEDLSKQWDAGGFPILNSAQLTLAKNGAMGPKAQQIATKLSAQIADLTSELGTVYKGGNSSTDESLKLAAKNLSENWSKDTLLANVDQIRKNLAIRQNSMTLAGGAAGVNKGNPYTPPTQPPASASPPDAATAPSAKSVTINGITLTQRPDGLFTSPSGGLYQAKPDGTYTRIK